MADPTKRIDNWVAKVTPERTAAQVTPQLTDIKVNAAEAMNSMVQTDTKVQQVCNAAGVSIIQYPYYLAFGREMWSLHRRGITGEMLAKEAAVLVAKWTARGLTSATLQDIRSSVFDIGAPVAP